jgi:predicted Zn-dependent protease
MRAPAKDEFSEPSESRKRVAKMAAKHKNRAISQMENQQAVADFPFDYEDNHPKTSSPVKSPE